MGEVLRDRYEVLEVVGQGGEGRVARALDRQHDRIVALKIRPVGDGERSRLLNEARVLLDVPPHPNLPLVREDFFDGDHYVIAMDWVEGTDLDGVLRGHGGTGLPLAGVLRWLADAAAALTHLHELDPPVVHGDVKPPNLVLTSGGRVVLVDFGLSAPGGRRGSSGGTRGYVAPEVAAGGPPTRAADIYSLAATAWALLTGGPPSGVLPEIPGLDAADAGRLVAAIRRGLATDPSKRPDTVGELVEGIRAGWLSTLPTGVLTFCATEVADAAVLWASAPSAMARATVRLDDMIAAAVSGAGGHVVAADGDTTVSAFASAALAVSAAVDIQRRVATWTDDDGVVPRVRTGLHTGAATRRGDGYAGPALVTTAGVRALAGGGEVLLSGSTAAIVRDGLRDEMGLVDLGVHGLPGMTERADLFALRAPGVAAPPPATTCPYPGLLAFGPDDRRWFAGRDDVVEDLVGRLHEGQLVALVGSSGSGKSSVLRAGVAPHFRGAVVTTPSDGSAALVDDQALLVVDQLEELFTVVRPRRRDAYIDAVLGRSGPIAFALRADFYGRCAEHPALARAVERSTVLLGPMSTDELRRAIVDPALACGLHAEPALVDVLVEEVAGEPGALPLLSHALRSTWQRRDGRALTLAAYQATGGVRGAIAATADEVLAGLVAGDQQVARSILVRLVEPGEGAEDTRRRARLDELRRADVESTRVEQIVALLAAARLVTVSADTIEVAHEALIREWPTLRSWLDEDREGLHVHRQLTAAARAWADLGRDPGELYRSARLAVAQEWSAGASDLSDLEREFLDASVAQRDAEQRELAQRLREQARTNRRLRALLASAVVLVVVAVIAAGVAVGQQRRGDRAATVAEARRLGTQALTVDDVDTGLLLAVEGTRLADSAETRANLLAALGRSPRAARIATVPDSRFLSLAATDDVVVVGDNEDRAHLYDAATLRPLDAVDWAGGVLAFSADGATLALDRFGDDGDPRIELVDVRTLTADERSLPVDGFPVQLTFAPDGSTLWVALAPAAPDAASAVLVWDLGTGNVKRHAVEADLGDSGSVNVTPDGTRFLVTTDGRTEIRDASTGAVVEEIAGTWPPALLSPDGATLAAATSGDATTLAVIDVATWQVRHQLAGHDARVLAVAFSADGSRLASGGDDRDVLVWSTASGDRELTLSGHAGKVTLHGVAFHADGRTLYSSGQDGRLVAWDLAGDRTLTRQLVPPGELDVGIPTVTTISPDGTGAIHHAFDAAPGDGDVVQIVDIETGASRRVPTGHGTVNAVDWSPDGRAFATAGDDGVVRWWGRTADEVTASHDGPEPVGSLDISADGSRVVIGDAAGRLSVLDDTLRPVRDAIDIGSAIDVVSVHPSGRTALVVPAPAPDEEVVVRAVDLTTGQDAGRFEAGRDWISTVTFSGDGRIASVASWDGSVLLVDTETWRPLGRIEEVHDGPVRSTAFSGDASVLLTTGTDGTVGLWDVATRRRLGAITPGRPNVWVAGRFGPDGHTAIVASNDGSVSVLDTRASAWREHACRVAGRDLTPDEWAALVGPRPRETPCGQS